MKHTSFPTKGEKRKFEKTYSYTPAADQINESNCDKLSIEALQGERGELNSELERVRRLYDDIAEQVTDLQSENQCLKNELNDALDVKQGNGPTALSRVVADRDRLTKINEELVKALEGMLDIYQKHASDDPYEDHTADYAKSLISGTIKSKQNEVQSDNQSQEQHG